MFCLATTCEPFFLSTFSGLSGGNRDPKLPQKSCVQGLPLHPTLELESAVHKYLGNYMAPSTRSVYSSAVHHYSAFCSHYSIHPSFPFPEYSLSRFASFLAEEGLMHRLIKSYLSGLWFSQIHQGLSNPFSADMPLLYYILAGIKREQAHHGAKPKPPLPISGDILLSLKCSWVCASSPPEGPVLWAMASKSQSLSFK